MKSFKLIKVFMTLMLLYFATPTTAQISIGMLEPPTNGALLQLKNLPADQTNANNLENANKGMILPRVELTDIWNLFPMFATGYKKDVEDLPHTGLVVYNVNNDLYNGDGRGIYYWDGKKWLGVGMVKRSIKLDPAEVYVSEIKPTATVRLLKAPLNLAYTSVDETDNVILYSKDANDMITIKSNPEKAGDGQYTYKINNSDKKATLLVHNLKLSLAKDVIKVGSEGTVSSTIVQAEGGAASWFVKSINTPNFNWVTPPSYKDGKLYFQLGKKEDVGTIKGTITVAHKNDPEYTKVLEVWQNKDYIMLPEFDYLVVKYFYNKTSSNNMDLDTATEINNTGIDGIDGLAVGFGTAGNNGGRYPLWSAYSLMYTDPATNNTVEILNSAGDNTVSGYESVYSNMTILRKVIPNSAPRDLNIDMYGNWWNPTSQANSADNKVKVSLTLYKGGTMYKKAGDAYNYYNMRDDGSDGEPVMVLSQENLPVDKGYNSSTYSAQWRTYFAPLLRLEYDRVDETGLIMRLTEIPKQMSARSKRSVSNASENTDSFTQQAGESKEALYKRYTDYVNQQVAKSLK